jgi:hypothetical protein
MPEILDAIADSGIPYAAKITVEGTNTLLFDRYNQDEIDVKKALPKGHVGKKMVDPEAQVYRHPKSGNLAVPGIAFLNAIEDAAKYVQTVPGRLEHSCKPLVVDLVSLDGDDELVDVGAKTWDAIDSKRISLGRGGADSILRPAILAGWRATFTLHVAVAGILPPSKLRECVVQAGQIKGIGAFRRVYGRFMVINFDYEI